MLRQNWHKLHFGNLDIRKQDDSYTATIPVYVGDVDVNTIEVQFYADQLGDMKSEIYIMRLIGPTSDAVNTYLYTVSISTQRPIEHYTPRIIPYFDGAAVPLEANNILWYER